MSQEKQPNYSEDPDKIDLNETKDLQINTTDISEEWDNEEKEIWENENNPPWKNFLLFFCRYYS